MIEIRLSAGAWNYSPDDRLGRAGGFGEVFRGEGPSGPVAVKRLKLTAAVAAHREMNIGAALAQSSHAHVVPVLDYGADANSDYYFLVMPVCERSLQDEIADRGPLPISEVRRIALDILHGLEEIPNIVHRDLKPANVLLYHGVWRLADFGIAKFVEESTSLMTLRDCLTPPYGAPEQWRGEAPTRATDVYALGCIFHAMVNGQPPFSGTEETVRDAHLHAVPTPLAVDPRLASFVSHMLKKAPDARPSAARCIEVIASTNVAPKPSHAALLAAASVVASSEAEAEAPASEARAKQLARDALFNEAAIELRAMFAAICKQIHDASPSAIVTPTSASLGQGTLMMADIVQTGRCGGRVELRSAPDQSPWDVVAYTTLSVARAARTRPSSTPKGYSIVYAGRGNPSDARYEWGASLFYGKSDKEPDYRWREVAFWNFARSADRDHPYSMAAETPEFRVALSPGMGVAQIAYGPLPIDGEDQDAFEGKWLTLFGRAAQGLLDQPNQMPIDPQFWRD